MLWLSKGVVLRTITTLNAKIRPCLSVVCPRLGKVSVTRCFTGKTWNTSDSKLLCNIRYPGNVWIINKTRNVLDTRSVSNTPPVSNKRSLLEDTSEQRIQQKSSGMVVYQYLKTAFKFLTGFVAIAVTAGGAFLLTIYLDEDDVDEVPISDDMRAPSRRSDITRDWLEYILTEHENKTHPGTKVVIQRIQIGDGMNPGEGYQSQIIKADVEAIVSRESDDRHSHKQVEYKPKQEKKVGYQLIIKLPSIDQADSQIQRTMKMNKKELAIYEVINNMNTFQETFAKDKFRMKLPLLYYGKCINDEFVLVLENLKVGGFENVSVRNGLNLEQILCVIEDLAKFHAVSYAYNLRHKFLGMYPCYKVDSTTSWLFTWHSTLFLDTVITYLKSKSEFKELAEKIESVKDELFSKYKEILQLASHSQVTCLTHGDIFTNNILFKTVENNKEKEMLDAYIIDWQLANWNSPLLDLHILLQTSTTKEFRRNHLDDVLQFYHSTFNNATTEMGAPIENWNYDDFKKEYNSYALFGLFKGLMLIQYTFSHFMKELKSVNFREEKTNPYFQNLGRKFARYFVSKMINPDNEHIFYHLHSLWTNNIAHEMIEGNNPELNNWVMDIITEADEKHIFDNNHS